MNLRIGIALLSLLLFAGCGSQGPQGPAGEIVIQPAPSPSSSPDAAILEIVNDYNEYLVSQGNDPITQGLRCTLYTIANLPATPCISASSIAGCQVLSSTVGYTTVGSFTYTGAINQSNESGTAGFNVLPPALQSIYSTNFAVTCTGYFVNTDDNYHEFDINSDDGSILSINGGVVANNDGLHGVADVKGEKFLQAQVYSFEVQYFQGPGNVALIVNMDGSVLPAANPYH